MSHRFLFVVNALKPAFRVKIGLALFIVLAPYQSYATPTGFGTLTRDSTPLPGSIVSGSYTTPTGATGTYTISAGASNGYSGRSFRVGNNGIEITNEANTAIANDRFTYTFSITPNDNTAIHTIKIGQASYATSGNSEVARHTLNFTKSTLNTRPVTATIKENPDVPYYYEAMGDYFMGDRVNNTTFSYNNAESRPQLRTDSGTNLYFYRLEFLNGTNQDGNRFTPSTTNNTINGQVSVRNGANGYLPPTPTLTNILKPTSTNPNNQNTYPPLNGTIPDGGNYVSYGIENTASNYVLAVRNASSVTLTYEGIMNGSNAFSGEKVGETFNEWISFGVESEPLNYIFSGTVFNDNGGITTPVADNVGPPYSNNNDYFNGILNSTEAGIAGSRVRVVDNCNNPTQTFATQTLIAASSGVYTFTIPVTQIGNRSSVCIIEDNNSAYPIRTTIDKRQVVFTTNNYTYREIDFGRVIDANRALVLRKEQSVNNCTISAFTDLTYSKDTINNTPPGQCIAYKITANNRANLPISNFIMQDELPIKGEKGSTVTSVLALPERVKSDYTDTLATGSNGTIVTDTFTLNSKSNRSFFFNTKYGTAQDR